ncbi:MAG: FxsA family protein [Deltaproteobacteria bacterium]|nr:FxsA family protein [Deltaproteobacteria bacterium]
MFGKLFLLFAVIPFLEIYTLVSMGRAIGTWPTIAMVLLTAAAGAYLAKMQGLATMLRIRDSLNMGLMPAEDMLDGVLIALASIVLVLPGFLTDLCGLVLLLPGPRNMFKRWLRKKFDQWRQSPNVQIRFYR